MTGPYLYASAGGPMFGSMLGALRLVCATSMMQALYSATWACFKPFCSTCIAKWLIAAAMSRSQLCARLLACGQA